MKPYHQVNVDVIVIEKEPINKKEAAAGSRIPKPFDVRAEKETRIAKE